MSNNLTLISFQTSKIPHTNINSFATDLPKSHVSWLKMMRGRPPVKSKPQTESGRERSLSGNGTGRSGHVQNVSGSMIDGDFINTNLQPESPGARKDQLQVNAHLFFYQISNLFFFWRTFKGIHTSNFWHKRIIRGI